MSDGDKQIIQNQKGLTEKIDVQDNKLDAQDLLISDLSATVQGFRDAIANNPLASPELRNSIVDVDRRLQEVKAGSTNLRIWEEGMIGQYRDTLSDLLLEHDKKVKAFHLNHQEHIPAFQYAISVLNTEMKNVAELKMDLLETNFPGLPLSISWEGATNIIVEELNLRTNKNWKVLVSFRSGLDNFDDVLTIRCDAGSVGVNGTAGVQDVFTRINGIPTDNIGPGSEYKKAIDKAVKALIGAQLYRDKTASR